MQEIKCNAQTFLGEDPTPRYIRIPYNVATKSTPLTRSRGPMCQNLLPTKLNLFVFTQIATKQT